MSRIHHALLRAESQRVNLRRERLQSQRGRGSEQVRTCVSTTRGSDGNRDAQGLRQAPGSLEAERPKPGLELPSLPEGLWKERQQPPGREIGLYARALSAQVEAQISTLARELLTEIRQGFEALSGSLPLQPSKLRHSQQEVQTAEKDSAREVAARPVSPQSSAQPLQAASEVRLQSFEESLRARVSPLMVGVEQTQAELDERSQHWSENVARQEVHWQRLWEKFNLQTEELQQKLDQQLRQFENSVHDTLVDARGQVKSYVQYGSENSLTSLEERARQAERRIGAAANRGVRQLNGIVNGAEDRWHGARTEAGQTVRAQREANLAVALGNFERTTLALVEVCRNKGEGRMVEVLTSMTRILRLWSNEIFARPRHVCEQFGTPRSGEEARGGGRAGLAPDCKMTEGISFGLRHQEPR